jgi:hypothetical protein
VKASAASLFLLPCLAFAQVAILQIRVVEGDGAVHQAGSRPSRPLVVEITDETGRPVGGAAVSFHLPDEGPGGSFTNGLKTEVLMADTQGRVSLRGLQLNRATGRFQIRIVASKEQARAGTVSFQYIAGPSGGGASTPSATAPASASKPRGGRKWWILAAAAGAAVAGGAAARSSGGGTGPAQPPGTGAITLPPPPTISIGSPTVTVGKP